MFTMRDYLVEEARRQNELTQAEKERLVQRVTRRNGPTTDSYQRWLARLGALLVTWGSQLQARDAT
jgi:hypothetical protein